MYATNRQGFHPFFGFGGVGRGPRGFGALLRELDAWERELARPAGQGDRVAVRVKEEAERFVVKALVPGLRLEELKLSLLERALTLSGERKAEPVEGYTPRRQERGAWRFHRTLELPDDVDAAQIEATLKDGVLTVVLPRVAPKLPRPIEVKLA